MFIMSLDISALVGIADNLQSVAEKALKKGGDALTASVYGKIVEQVQSTLHSSRDTYLQNLTTKQIDEFTFEIELAPPAVWIEDGIPPNTSMVDALLDDSPKPGYKGLGGVAKGKTMTSKSGARYRYIPFQHNKGPASQTPAARDLTDTIKRELKRRGAPYGKVENGPDGKPKLGLVRSFDILKAPVKTLNGPGQGKGPIGEVRQGNTGIPLLAGVRVYQKEITESNGKSKVKRYIMTFRTVSSKDRGTDKWRHPGLVGKNLFGQAEAWARETWERDIVPMVLEDILKNI